MSQSLTGSRYDLHVSRRLLTLIVGLCLRPCGPWRGHSQTADKYDELPSSHSTLAPF